MMSPDPLHHDLASRGLGVVNPDKPPSRSSYQALKHNMGSIAYLKTTLQRYTLHTTKQLHLPAWVEII